MTNQPVTVLPAALREWRAARGLSQQALADSAGVSAGMIALIETKRRQPSLQNLIAIARALEVTPHAIALVNVDVADLMPDEVAS